MRSHNLKTYPSQFGPIVSKVKPWEYRENDRDFEVGDTLVFREFVPGPCGDYSDRKVSATVTYILHGGRFGIPPGFCIMSIKVEG